METTDKVKTLMELEGFETAEEMLDDMINGMGNYGICTTVDCDNTADVEHDSDSGWCDECKTNTVASPLMLMGMI